MLHFPGELSGGQQLRVAIARAFAGTPVPPLANEPAGNLDTQVADAVIDILLGLNDEGMTIKCW